LSPSEIWVTPRNSPGSMYAETGETFDKRMQEQGHSPRHMETIARQAVNFWPTPIVDDGGSKETHRGQGTRVKMRGAVENFQNHWPTARAEDSESCGNHPGAVDSLTDAIRLWPTPDANAWKGGNHSGSGSTSSHSVATLAERWATPQAHDGMGGPRTAEQLELARAENKGGCCNLSTDAILRQTPGTDSFRSRGGDRNALKRGDEMGLDQEARHWGTPTTRDWKDGATSLENTPINGLLGRQVLPWSSLPAPQTPETDLWRTPQCATENSLRGSGQDPEKRKAQGHNVMIQDQACYWEPSPPAPQTLDGELFSGSGQTSRRLSPRFVEWLMNFPIGWTELSKPPCPTEPNGSGD